MLDGMGWNTVKWLGPGMVPDSWSSHRQRMPWASYHSLAALTLPSGTGERSIVSSQRREEELARSGACGPAGCLLPSPGECCLVLDGSDHSHIGVVATMKEAWAFVLSVHGPRFYSSLRTKIEKTGTQSPENRVTIVNNR